MMFLDIVVPGEVTVGGGFCFARFPKDNLITRCRTFHTKVTERTEIDAHKGYRRVVHV